MDKESPQAWATVRSAARYLDCSITTVERHIRQGRIPAYKVADQRSVRVKVADLDALMTRAER
ncbi:helix-turn-helix domain-containing protein [Rhodococcoides fascians]|uniref:helix-turn-helix domain-containing protein n=1 Tax=Rhodococcoides fascians TaxID=1828 RepID=UPI0018AFAED3